jgi:hypothetical protein
MRTAPILIAIALFVPVSNALADIVASQSGSDVEPWTLDSSQALAVSWTSTQTFTNVTVDVTLDGDPSVADGSTVQAYLMDNIGATATPSDVLDSNTFLYTSGPTDETFAVFSGLTLSPGPYYLVLYNPGTSGAWWGSFGSELQTTDSGVVTINSDEYASTPNGANPYASSFSSYDLGLHFSVTEETGSSTSPVPEPSSVLMLAGIFACGILLRIKKARTS